MQVGTNLSMVRLAAEAERWLHKPVIAINAATWWMALRDNGIDDPGSRRTVSRTASIAVLRPRSSLQGSIAR